MIWKKEQVNLKTKHWNSPQQSRKNILKSDSPKGAFGTMSSRLTFTLYGSQKKKEERKAIKVFLKK